MRLQNKILQISVIAIYAILLLDKVFADELRCDYVGGDFNLCSSFNYKPYGILKYETIVDKSDNFYFGKFLNIESGFILFKNIKIIYNYIENSWFLMDDENKIITSLSQKTSGERINFIYKDSPYYIIIDELNIPVNDPTIRMEMVNTISLRIGRK